MAFTPDTKARAEELGLPMFRFVIDGRHSPEVASIDIQGVADPSDLKRIVAHLADIMEDAG